MVEKKTEQLLEGLGAFMQHSTEILSIRIENLSTEDHNTHAIQNLQLIKFVDLCCVHFLEYCTIPNNIFEVFANMQIAFMWVVFMWRWAIGPVTKNY